MRDKLVLRFLGFLETIKYILEQSHGVPPVSVALDHTTFKEEGSCGYSSVKTVRSIDFTEVHGILALTTQCLFTYLDSLPYLHL